MGLAYARLQQISCPKKVYFLDIKVTPLSSPPLSNQSATPPYLVYPSLTPPPSHPACIVISGLTETVFMNVMMTYDAHPANY